VTDEAASAAHDLVVLVVAYKSADKLEKCLRAAERYLPGREVYVWDNSGPTHPDIRALAEHFGHVRWFTNSDNIGFAAAVNRLAEMVPDRDMLLLNPDAELLGPLALTRAALREPRVAAVAPMVSDGDLAAEAAPLLSAEQMPWDVAHRRVTLVSAICGIALPPQRLRGTWLSDRYRSKPSEVKGYLTGACLAIRRDAWDALGPLDEEFFLYGEEADWQSRARAAGWRLRLTDEIGVRHAAHGTVAGDSVASRRSEDLFRAGVALQLEYRYGKWAAGCFLATTSLIEVVKQRLRRGSEEAANSDVLVTINSLGESALPAERISMAIELTNAGYAVTVVSLGRLGQLPRHVPATIRLIRRPWWWPSAGPDRTPRVLVEGATKQERAFARLFRIRRNRFCVQPSAAFESLANMSQTHSTANRPNAEGD
jgi:GT2 family glycosyltransferase